MIEFIGRLHPLLVHLPIGIIGLALFIKMVSLLNRWMHVKEGLFVIMLCAFITAVLSAMTGLILSNSGGYETNLISSHKWSAIGLTVFSGIIMVTEKKQTAGLIPHIVWILLGLSWVIAGHFGGSLTHGKDYLFGGSGEAKTVLQNIDTENAYFHQDIIQPILEAKCFSCHSSKKQKGKLRLDSREWIMKGGKNGEVVIPNQPEDSPLYQRIKLVETDEDHMPPKGKLQLTDTEIAIIGYWISGGVDFDEKFVETKHYHPALKKLTEERETEDEKALKEIDPFDPGILDSLREMGIVALPIALNSNYISINLLENKEIEDEDLRLLDDIKHHIISLKAGNTSLTDSALGYIGKMESLSILHLNNTGISDLGIVQLADLSRLRILNLTNTGVTEEGIKELAKLDDLQSIYLFQTKVDPDAWKDLEKIFQHTKLDSGGYAQWFLGKDTVK